jgi:hypothetical protein
MNESEKQFSFTRAASSTSGRAQKQIPISWIAVTNVPTVTSTQYQVILDPTNGNSFYRLLNP